MISKLSCVFSSQIKTTLFTFLFNISLISASNAEIVSIENWEFCNKKVNIKTHLNDYNNNYLEATSDHSRLLVGEGKSEASNFIRPLHKSLKGLFNVYCVCF